MMAENGTQPGGRGRGQYRSYMPPTPLSKSIDELSRSMDRDNPSARQRRRELDRERDRPNYAWSPSLGLPPPMTGSRERLPHIDPIGPQRTRIPEAVAAGMTQSEQKSRRRSRYLKPPLSGVAENTAPQSSLRGRPITHTECGDHAQDRGPEWLQNYMASVQNEVDELLTDLQQRSAIHGSHKVSEGQKDRRSGNDGVEVPPIPQRPVNMGAPRVPQLPIHHYRPPPAVERQVESTLQRTYTEYTPGDFSVGSIVTPVHGYTGWESFGSTLGSNRPIATSSVARGDLVTPERPAPPIRQQHHYRIDDDTTRYIHPYEVGSTVAYSPDQGHRPNAPPQREEPERPERGPEAGGLPRSYCQSMDLSPDIYRPVPGSRPLRSTPYSVPAESSQPPVYQIGGEQLKALVGNRGESRGPFSNVALPKYEEGRDFAIFIHSFLDLMELHNVHPTMQLTYLQNAIPQEGVDLLSYGQVRTMDEALHVLWRRYDPLQTPSDLRNHFTSLAQEPGESLDRFVARLRHGMARYLSITSMAQNVQQQMLVDQFTMGIHDDKVKQDVARQRFLSLDEALPYAHQMTRWYKGSAAPKKVRVMTAPVVDTNATTDLEKLTKRLAELEMENATLQAKQELSRAQSSPPQSNRKYSGRGGKAGKAYGEKGGRKKFEPRCYCCGNLGHLANQCVHLKEPTRLCFECQEEGHIRRDCPMLKERRRAENEQKKSSAKEKKEN